MQTIDLINQLARDRFGIPTLRPYQQLVIQRVLELDRSESDHEGVVVTLPTGSGKSICFMLPSLVVEGLTIIVYPLLSLMNDQIRRFSERHIRCVCIQGGQTPIEREALFASLANTKPRIVVTNAECLAQSSVFTALARFPISLLVLDEAHTIVRWGEGFRPAMASLGPIIAHLPLRQILCFTATADDAIIGGLTNLIFNGVKPHLVRSSSDRQNISYHAIPTLSKEHTIARLLKDQANLPALVFCSSRDATKLSCLAFLLSNPAISCRYYHAGLGKKERKTLEAWYQREEKGVLFATNAFGMGVDKRSVRMVIHHDLPSDVLSFLQESGRAGRDGIPSRSVVLLDGKESSSTLLSIFSSKSECFRSSLLFALGEEMEGCSGCDVCNHTQYRKREGEKTLMRCVALHPFSYSIHSLAVLLHTKRPWKPDSGLLNTWRARAIEYALNTLVAEGKLSCTKGKKQRLYLSVYQWVALLTARKSAMRMKI
ncbi:ATP-dependent RNA helicase DbpA [bioreactor metagenome]|uniref:DNA 3'-5' helicase n=1 Tax=bioreactor metagenome TaxID=1076179 RepID=A0A644WYY4_9ZZZZ